MCWGHGVWGARSQRGPLGGQGGQSRGDGSLLGCIASPRGCCGRLLLAFRMAGRLGPGAPGVQGMPRGPLWPLLEDVGGSRLVVHRGGGMHRVPCQVFQHHPVCVVFVCTQGAFRWLCGPPRQGERHRLSDGALWCWVEGQVGQWNRVRRQRAARGGRIQGSCCGRGPETPDGVALCVCLQPLLPWSAWR